MFFISEHAASACAVIEQEGSALALDCQVQENVGGRESQDDWEVGSLLPQAPGTDSS